MPIVLWAINPKLLTKLFSIAHARRSILNGEGAFLLSAEAYLFIWAVNSTTSRMPMTNACLFLGPFLYQTMIHVGMMKNSGMNGRLTERSHTPAVAS